MNRMMVYVLILVSFSGFALAQSDAADEKLVLKWTMRDSRGSVVEDFSGKNHFGLLTGEAFFKVDPRMQSTVAITSNSGFVSTPYDPDLEPARGTVETWIKIDVMRNADIFNKFTFRQVRTGAWGGKSVYGMHLNDDASLTGFVMNDDPKEVGPWVGIRSRGGLVKTGEWYLVALSWDEKEVAIFLNGEKLGSRKYRQIPVIGLSYSRESYFSLGQPTYWGGSDHGFLGQFGETTIYNRSLSNKELFAHYAAKQATN